MKIRLNENLAAELIHDLDMEVVDNCHCASYDYTDFESVIKKYFEIVKLEDKDELKGRKK